MMSIVKSPIAIRPMTVRDAPAVSRIVAEGYRFLAEKEGFSDIQLRRLLDERCTEGVFTDGWLRQWDCYIAERLGNVVGALALDKNEIAELYVSTKHHRQGVGRALLDFAEQRIAEAGFDALALRCAGLSAAPFYLAQGLKPTGITTCPFGPLKDWPLTSYQKPLRPTCAQTN